MKRHYTKDNRLMVKNFNEGFYSKYHKWEVIMPIGGGRFRIETWEKENPEGYERPEDQYNAMIDLVNGCRFSGTDYYVFMDDELTDL